VTWEQRVLAGDPKFETSQTIPAFPFAAYAELLGLEGIRVDRPDHVGPAWDAALSADRPVVIDAITDPNVPPLPPHIEFQQARSYMTSMLKGDPDTMAHAKQSVKQMLQSWLPKK
jgi:pyruvate dehydrogenase (quinone)